MGIHIIHDTLSLLADMDRPMDMVELTVVGLIPPQALG
jgi:hypothetical protein